ncbi:MAG: glutamine amidotransferase [Hyphomicrobiaceae bacterium]|nr:glutamine amidotransferase [Hyphomicrobiaceae bacterium]
MLDGGPGQKGLVGPHIIAPYGLEGVRKLPVLMVLHQEHSNPGHVGQWFRRNGHALDIRKPRFGEPLPETLAQHCGAVIFGGPMSANDPDDFMKIETDWIGVALKEKKPYFGVCLGAQMLARHLGAAVSLDREGQVEIGYYDVAPTEAGRDLGQWPAKFYEWHKEGFDVPRGGQLLARRDGAFPNQAFSYGAAAVGVQFHPEITLQQVHRWSGNNLVKLTQPGARPQLEHFDGHMAHAAQVHVWLHQFLSRWVQATLPL